MCVGTAVLQHLLQCYPGIAAIVVQNALVVLALAAWLHALLLVLKVVWY
jgi:predicted aconitase with swiveling domain